MTDQLANIIDRINQTKKIITNIFMKMMDRGMTIEEIKVKSDILLVETDVFKKKIIPWHKRVFEYIFFCPNWWCVWDF